MVVSPPRVSAQDARATLLGSVTDASHSGIPNALLTLTHIDTERRYTAQSNAEGHYFIPYLPAGGFRLRVESQGFRTYERADIRLRTSDRVRVNVALEVSTLQENVSVLAEPPLFGADDATSGSLIDGDRIAELPIAHGNVYHLTRLSAGVAYAGNGTLDRPYDPTHIANYTIAGAYGLRNEITLDGSPNSSMTAGRNQNAAAYVPPADLVAEMRITTVAFDASIGHTEGGAIAVSLKSGSNAPHATAYYHNQDPVLSANSWLGNKRAQSRPDFRYGRWGASLHGPVYIPGLYDGANRTFFLWGHEGIHERRPRSLGFQTVPTIEQRHGDFSALLALGGSYQLYDPATRRSAPGGGTLSDPFPGNIIPHTRINPIARRILQYFSPPNATGGADGRNNFARTDLAETIAYWNEAFRIDHNAGTRHRLFLSGGFYTRNSDYLNYFGNPATGEVFRLVSRRAALDDVYVISSATVLNLRYSYNRFIRSADLNPDSHGFDLTTLAPDNAAWAAWNDSIDPRTRRFPLVDITGYYDLVGTSSSGVLFRPQDTHSLAAAVDRISGAHTMKAGVEYRVYRKSEYSPYPPSSVGDVGGSSTGWLQFGDDWTKGPTDTSPAPSIGAGLASFLLGLPTGGGIASRGSFAEQSSVASLYFHDNWKATPRLTLTLGLRYELEGPLVERHNRSVRGFDPGAPLPIAAAVQANYARIASQIPELSELPVRGGLTFAGVDGQPRTLYDRDFNNLAPRVGVAFSLNSRTMLRAGYGVFFGAQGVRRGDVYQTGFSQTTPLVASRDNGLTFVATLDNPFPQGVLPPPGSSRGAMTAAGDEIEFFNTAFVAPLIQRWQFSVQRELPAHYFVEAAYVGSRGQSLETTRNLNGLPLAHLSRSALRDQARIDYLDRRDLANPFYGVLPATTPLGGSARINRASLLVAYPQFTRMETTTNEGASSYHSLALKLERRIAGRHTAGVSYTWSKLMESIAYLNDMDPAPTRAISASDYPHRLAASWIYELPFGGRRLGGWQIEGIYVYQMGAPLGFDNIGFLGDLRDIALPRGMRSADRWFNTGAGFIRDPAQALAYNLRTFPLRLAGVRGPGVNNWDLSLLKNTRLTDRTRLEFRAEFFNAMNHAWFGTPNTNPLSSSFGTITTESGYTRRIQLGVRLLY